MVEEKIKIRDFGNSKISNKAALVTCHRTVARMTPEVINGKRDTLSFVVEFLELLQNEVQNDNSILFVEILANYLDE